MSADASARVIWRDAGRAVNGSGTSPVRAAIHERTFGQAGAALARPETGLAGALEELEFGVAAVPGGREVGDGRAHAAADDALGRWRRERLVGGRVADDGDGHRAGHPGEQVARREAEVDDDGVGGGRRLGAGRRVGGDDGRHAAVLAFEADEVGRPTGDDAARGRRPPPAARSAARAVTIPASRLPGQTGWISAAPVATTISCGWTWSMPCLVRTTIIGPA